VGHLWLAVLLGGTLGPAVVRADDFGPRVVASRWALVHGRVDEIREKGLATSANPKGESIPGLSALLGKITMQGDPLRISLELNKEGTQAKSGKANEIVLAAAGLPTGMSLVVAETGPAPAKVVWEPMVPRFGNGNLYATVSIPDAGIVAGQELHTAEHFKAYAANSVIYEAPDFGNVVISHALVGGTLNVAARIGGDRLQVHYKRIGYSQPLKLELKEDKQVRNRVGDVEICLRAELPVSFESTRTFRIAAETRKKTVFKDMVTMVKPGQRENIISITVPADTEGQVKISVVASPGPFLKSLPSSSQAIGLQTFQSRGPTLEDTCTVQIKPMTTKVVHGELTKGLPFDSKRKGCHAKVYSFPMEKGATYLFDLESFDGRQANNPAFFDTYLRIEDASGKELDYNDDGGEGLNARLAFTAPSTGDFRIVVTSFRTGVSGTYVLKIRY
jgi:hypothetical protein